MVPWHLLVCGGINTSLADAVVASSGMLASAKPTRISDDGRERPGRGQLDISFVKRPTPLAVQEIIEIQEKKVPAPAEIERRREIDARAQSFLDEQDVAGIAIFNDGNRRRKSE